MTTTRKTKEELEREIQQLKFQLNEEKEFYRQNKREIEALKLRNQALENTLAQVYLAALPITVGLTQWGEETFSYSVNVSDIRRLRDSVMGADGAHMLAYVRDLREAIAPFAKVGMVYQEGTDSLLADDAYWHGVTPTGFVGAVHTGVTVGDLRRAARFGGK